MRNEVEKLEKFCYNISIKKGMFIMSNIICQLEQCPFRKGTYCQKDFVMLNQFGQCDEHWNKMGQPIPMRDLTVENVMKDKETAEKSLEKEVENDETEGKNTEENTNGPI